MRKRNHHLLAMLLALIILSLCGCGGSSKSTPGGARAETVMETTAAAMTASASYDGMIEEAPMERYEYSSAEAGAGDTGGSTGSGGLSSTSGINTAEAVSRKLIRTVHLNVETDTFDDLLTHLQQQITGLSGYIEQSDVSGNSMHRRNSPSSRYASITARIPSDSLDQFITAVEGSGNVTYKSESTSDVTLKYTDLESRKKSLAIEQERIWELLEKADSLEAVITLEERLSEIRYELESMESQLRLYDNQVSYSTVYINIDEVTTFTQVEPETIGQQIQREFLENLKAVGDAVTALIIGIITSSPVWVPLLIIVLIFVKVIRRRKRVADSIYSAACQTPLTPSDDDSSSPS